MSLFEQRRNLVIGESGDAAAHAPLKGGFLRWISSTLGSASLVITIQSAVTAGLGYLYVYAMFSLPSFIANIVHQGSCISLNVYP